MTRSCLVDSRFKAACLSFFVSLVVCECTCTSLCEHTSIWDHYPCLSTELYVPVTTTSALCGFRDLIKTFHEDLAKLLLRVRLKMMMVGLLSQKVELNTARLQ